MSEQKPVALKDLMKANGAVVSRTNYKGFEYLCIHINENELEKCGYILAELLKAEREKAIRASVLYMEPDFNEEQIKSIVDEILSTDESKENEVKK